MFGLFMITLCSIAYIYTLVGQWNNEHKRKINAIKKGAKFYIDRNGQKVNAKTNVPYKEILIDGERVVIQPYTGKIIKNITAENRKEMNNNYLKLKKLSKENKITYFKFFDSAYMPFMLYDPMHDITYEWCPIHYNSPTELWGNANNNEIYFIRKIIMVGVDVDVFLNIKTGKVDAIKEIRLLDNKDKLYKLIMKHNNSKSRSDRLIYKDTDINWFDDNGITTVKGKIIDDSKWRFS